MKITEIPLPLRYFDPWQGDEDYRGTRGIGTLPGTIPLPVPRKAPLLQLFVQGSNPIAFRFYTVGLGLCLN